MTRLDSNRIVKRYHEPGWAELEVARTRLAGMVGEASGRFVAPMVLDHDSHSIVFELLPGFRDGRAVLKSAGARTFANELGRALAVVHAESFSDEEDLGQVDVRAEPDPVLLHGDFGLGNVGALEDTGQIAILDWSVARWLQDSSGYLGSSQIDIVMMLQSIFDLLPGMTAWSLSPEQAAREFLTGYSASRDVSVAEIRATDRAVARKFADQKPRLRVWTAGYPYRLRRRHFVGRLESKGWQ